jgi:translocation and assembly module TamA
VYPSNRMNPTVFALVLAVSALGSFAYAADPQPYKVDIASVGDSDMDATVKTTSDLQSLRGTAPVSPFGLIARARGDADRLKTAVESFGYYQSSVVIKINGMLLSNPALGDALSVLPKGTDAQVSIGFTLGPLYHLGRIDIDGELPEGVRNSLGLTTGEPAVAATVLGGGARLLTALQERGYAFAQVDAPVAYEAADTPVLDVRFHVVVGAKVNIGVIHIDGLQRVHESLLRARLMLHTGDPFSPSAIERARHDLLGLGVFGQVSVQIGTAVDDSGGVPITFKIRERLRHAIGLSAAYSSDLGGSGGVTWTDRNVFGNAEQLSFAASVINLGGSDTTGVGYDTSVKYLIPDFGHRDQTLQFAVGAIKQSLQAYDQTALTTGVTLARKISSQWSVSIGGATTEEKITQITSENICQTTGHKLCQTTGDITAGEIAAGDIVVPISTTYYYTLLALPMNVGFDSTNLASPLDDPHRGLRASITITPTLALGHPNALFVISQIKASAYFDLDHLLSIAPGRTVLAGRAVAGIAAGASELSLPPDQRFYAGGSGTIRGYAYQSVGPKFNDPDQTPIGGTAITAGSLELRQRFGTNWGAAVFVDAGQVSASLKAVEGEFDIGAGVGLRYYTPIGPIRLDVAMPTKRLPAPYDNAFEIYIGLGQAF